jgi:crotonobetainyl-CoA:carnitine CoA-transferase CaiB-like acyl-CoA transferase
MDLPLQGMRVLDLTRAVAGPLCTALLSDFGAEIIKVEGTPSGDPTRAWGPFDGDESIFFASVNRGKQSILMDFRAEGSMQLLREMLADIDVLIENFRPGVLTTMGLDPDELRAEFPRLIIASISGFGAVGPERETPGLDQVAQGMSGLMSVTGPDKSHFYRVGVPIIDEVTGMFAALGIVAAIAGRERDSQGARVETSLLESAISTMLFQALRYVRLGEVPEPQGNHHAVVSPYGSFATADMPISIAVGTQKQWAQLCVLLGDPALAESEDYVTGDLRNIHRTQLTAEIERLLAAHPGKYWLEKLRELGIPSGPIYTVDQTFADPQVQALDFVREIENDRGKTVSVIRGPISINGKPTPVQSAPPAMGGQGAAILESFGYDESQIASLVERGIIRLPEVR